MSKDIALMTALFISLSLALVAIADRALTIGGY